MEIVGERSSSKRVSKEHRVQEPKPSNKPVDVIPPPSHKSSRVPRPPERYLGILTEDLEKALLVGDRNIRNNLKTYNEAMLDIDFEKWIEAMKSEIDSMHSNQV